MKVIEERLVTNAEAKKILEKREGEGELHYEQKNALDVLRKVLKVDIKKIEKIVEELKTIPKLREFHIISIANLLPEDKDDLRLILQKEYNVLEEDEIKKILEIIKKNV